MYLGAAGGLRASGVAGAPTLHRNRVPLTSLTDGDIGLVNDHPPRYSTPPPDRFGSLVLIGLSLIASFWVAQGWASVAHDWLGIVGPEAYLLFGLFECVVVFLIRHAYRARLARDPTAILWTAIWVLTTVGVTTQVTHAITSSHPGSALVYGPASLITVGLWQLKIFQGSREQLRAQGLLAPPDPGFPLRFRRRFRGLVRRAVLVASYEGIDQPEAALVRARQLYPDTSLPWERAQALAALRVEKGLGQRVLISRRRAAGMLAEREAQAARIRGELVDVHQAHQQELAAAAAAAEGRVAAERAAKEAAEAQVADLTVELERGVAELNAVTATARAQFATEIEQLRAILTRETALREAAQLRAKQLEEDLVAARASAERTAERLTAAALASPRTSNPSSRRSPTSPAPATAPAATTRNGSAERGRSTGGGSAGSNVAEDTGTHRVVPLRTAEERVEAMIAHTSDPDHRWTAREVRSIAGGSSDNWRDYVSAWSEQLRAAEAGAGSERESRTRARA